MPWLGWEKKNKYNEVMTIAEILKMRVVLFKEL